MTLEKKPFVKYDLEDNKIDVVTVKFNKEEREALEESKKIIEQSKDSTALKTLAWIGAKVIREAKTKYLIESIFKNKRNNVRSGIADFE